MNLLYLVFGENVRIHFQAHFSILTFLRHRPAGLGTITVVTDAPDFYRHLADHVTVLPVSAATLQAWRGEFDFFWRIKIKALEHVAALYPGVPLLYLDSDTFLHGSFTDLHKGLAAGYAYMHEPEGALAALGSKTEKRMWQQIGRKTFGGITLHERHQMWNAGVVGIPAQGGPEAIALALRICDDLSRAGVTPRLIEQFALALALQERFELRPARPFIGHYWSNKEEWNEAIASFLLESSLKGRSVTEDVAAVAHFNFQAVPVVKKLKNTRWRLVRLVDRLFPPRQVRYVE
ncbi:MULTISPECIES: hypothetical protein [Hymenobacter]|uniref:Nucleotide-diphospho-sugar transferase domain-containing protein n=1 Tax=Hymenobacter mucosus TaxID=1411120 RepID=A0A238YKK4_9BACT|nr:MULTISPECIES: hypothetical protein [Hymenobacter]SNR71154.1 hypothetical protein SAMN06269173_105287 [Hymenobacter mucosus]